LNHTILNYHYKKLWDTKIETNVKDNKYKDPNMVDMNLTMSVIKLNINILSKIKRRIVSLDEKTRLNYMLSTRNAL
jgi:hypothetical protein